MALTGRPGEPPLGPPRGLVPRLESVAAALARGAGALGGRLDVDPLALLGERAAIAGLTRQGDRSCGGATRLLRAADGWLAVSLARDDDVALVPAWLEIDPVAGDVWEAVAAGVRERRRDVLVERATLLGLPVGALGEREPLVLPAVGLGGPAGSVAGVPGEPPLPPPGGGPGDLAGAAVPVRSVAGPPVAPAGRRDLAGLPVRARSVAGPRVAPGPLRDLRVVDLGALWAGPLCGGLLGAAGAGVVKVESTGRPDGARRGPAGFFDLLNGGKRSVALDLGSREGVAALRALLGAADVVVEAARPRALAQLGIDREALVAAGGPRVWLSITGHGREGEAGRRVGFGDDAAAAGGLVVRDARGPCFCADAVADPASGLVAAAAALAALAAGGRWLVDVALAEVAAHLAGPTLPVPPGTHPAPPRARPVTAPAPALGRDTAAVLAGVGAWR